MNESVATIKLQGGDRFARVIFVPDVFEGYGFLAYRNFIKQNDGIGIKRILIKNIHFIAVAREVVVITNYGILIKGIGFKPFKAYAICAYGKVFFRDYFKAVVDYCLKDAFRKCDKIIVILYNCIKGQGVCVNINARKVKGKLILRFYTCHNGFVSVDKNILDFRAVDVLYSVDGVFYNSAYRADVIL